MRAYSMCEPVTIKIVPNKEIQSKKRRNIEPFVLTAEQIRSLYPHAEGVYPANVCGVCFGIVFDKGICIRCINRKMRDRNA